MKGYKGFDKNLKCKGLQYTIGEVTSINCSDFKICTETALHFCGSLKEAFQWYPNNGINRFCEVEVEGPILGDSKKYATQSIKVIREITKEELLDLLLIENLNLDLVQKIQAKYPLCHVGG